MTAGHPTAGEPRHHDFEDRLRGILALHGKASRGRLYVLELARIRDSLGNEWDRLAAKVHGTCDAVLRYRLTGQQIFIRYDDTRYLVAFGGNLDEAQARIKLALLSKEITQQLFGADPAEDVIDLKAAQVSPEGEILFTSASDLDSLVQPTGSSSAPRSSDELEGIGFIFRPLWFVKKRVISNHLCLPVTPRDQGGFLSGYQLIHDPGVPTRLLELDLVTLRRGCEEIRKLADRDSAGLVTVPVHFESLALVARRNQYVEACIQMVGKNGNRHLVFEVVKLPEGIPPSRLLELTQALKPLGRSVMARFNLAHRKFAGYYEVGLLAAGVDIFDDTRSEKAIMESLDGFTEAASSARLQTYIHGIRSLSLCTAAICAGFNYVDGYAVSSVEEAAQDLRQYDIRTPYDRKLGTPPVLAGVTQIGDGR